MYAEIGQLSFSQQTNTISLVDTEDRIEYAQIKHSIFTDEATKTRNEQSPEKDEINGMTSIL